MCAVTVCADMAVPLTTRAGDEYVTVSTTVVCGTPCAGLTQATAARTVVAAATHDTRASRRTGIWYPLVGLPRQ